MNAQLSGLWIILGCSGVFAVLWTCGVVGVYVRKHVAVARALERYGASAAAGPSVAVSFSAGAAGVAGGVPAQSGNTRAPTKKCSDPEKLSAVPPPAPRLQQQQQQLQGPQPQAGSQVTVTFAASGPAARDIGLAGMGQPRHEQQPQQQQQQPPLPNSSSNSRVKLPGSSSRSLQAAGSRSAKRTRELRIALGQVGGVGALSVFRACGLGIRSVWSVGRRGPHLKRGSCALH
jgi:hypothetical protein